MNVDRSWSKESLQIGFHKSLRNHVAGDGLNFSNGSMPVVGKQAIAKHFVTHSDSSYTLQWEPLRCSVAASGDLGYTFGAFTMLLKENNKDTTLYGNYVTVWERQPDGTWKFVVDGGGDTPKPVRL